MKCYNCNKSVWGRMLCLSRNGKPLHTGFCDYECYLKFWERTPNFQPLPEYKKVYK